VIRKYVKKTLTALLVLLSASFVIIAEDEIMIIDSNLADYDGKKITLSGNVIVDHELGKIAANQVIILPGNDEKKLRFAHLQMVDQVIINLRDGGLLTCACADLDFRNMSGKFSGNRQQEYVTYTESLRDRSNNQSRVPLVVKSCEMTVGMGRREASDVSPAKSYITDILADEHVTINYNHDFIASADQALYKRSEDHLAAEGVRNTLSGSITLRAYEHNGLCQVTNLNGDLINAAQIHIDTIKRHLTFTQPIGTLCTNRDEKHQEQLAFSADILTWEESKDLLRLQNHVVLFQQGLGNLKSDKDVQITLIAVNGRKQLRTIDCFGQTELIFSDETKKISHKLTCYGRANVNHLNLKTVMQSPLDETGLTLADQQIFFEDRNGEIFADKLTLEYAYRDGVIVPAKLILEGNVNILNRFAEGTEENPKDILQYAIADIVEYNPKTLEMSFYSSKNRRVLFFDKVNNIQVSAPALKIKRDAATKKETIKGIGDVRFSFAEHELEQLKKRFHFDESVQK
jgi:hypothetical protein